MTYSSNAIEGKHLTLKETYLVLREGITVKGKKLKNDEGALKYLFDIKDSKNKNI
jgi:hypothetical protein